MAPITIWGWSIGLLVDILRN